MKKPFKYNELSSQLCACGCGKFIKKNVLARNPKAQFRYGHDPDFTGIVPKDRNKKRVEVSNG